MTSFWDVDDNFTHVRDIDASEVRNRESFGSFIKVVPPFPIVLFK